MKFSLRDKILLPQIFPREGKFETLIILEDIKKKVSVTQEEITEFEIKTQSGNIIWNENGAKKEFDINFTEIEENTISDILKKLSEEGKLSIELLQLYKLFVK